MWELVNLYIRIPNCLVLLFRVLGVTDLQVLVFSLFCQSYMSLIDSIGMVFARLARRFAPALHGA
jgi:hypothetical protein